LVDRPSAAGGSRLIAVTIPACVGVEDVGAAVGAPPPTGTTRAVASATPRLPALARRRLHGFDEGIYVLHGRLLLTYGYDAPVEAPSGSFC
jgi:hypothetical protein